MADKLSNQIDCIEMIIREITEINDFHYLAYHVEQTDIGVGVIHPFIWSLSIVLSSIENVSSGYASTMITRICSYHGDNEDNYNQLLSIFAEISAAYRASQVSDVVNSQKVFIQEPRVNKHSKNPEFASITNGIGYAVEVKAPKILKQQRKRKSGTQLTARRDLSCISNDKSERVILPIDNPVKDFLISANSKFEQYKLVSSDDYCLLFIFWDDYIYEPLTALLHPLSGLLTENTFYRDEENNVVKFSYIDGIVIFRQLLYMQESLADLLLTDPIAHAFDMERGLQNVFIQNPHGKEVPDTLYMQFNALPPDQLLGAEYQMIDFVFFNEIE